ncbi:MAG: TetR/AcrR family transcriptional regulator [Candidatus Heimdallarchaeota archaeon]|nr:TetR/AcrR family transcriptional regulator [Candidatus Heimdallarchaeota archaeon]
MDESSPRRKRKKKRTRDLILSAAWDLYVKKGFNDVSMEEIGELADVSRSSLYNYFPHGKEGLFFTACIEKEREIREQITLNLPENLSVIEELTHRFTQMLEFMLDYPFLIEGQRKFLFFSSGEETKNLYLKIDREQVESNQIDKKFLQEFHPDLLELENSWVTLLEKGIHEGSINREYNPKQYSVIIWSLLTGMADQISLRKRMIMQYDLGVDDMLQIAQSMLVSILKND